MTDDRELDDGLAAFDRLGREMAETNRLLHDLQTSQKAREARESSLSADFQAALKQAAGASQKALQATQTEIRSYSTLDESDGLPDRSGGVWRGGISLAIRPESRKGGRKGIRPPMTNRPARAGPIPRPDSAPTPSTGSEASISSASAWATIGNAPRRTGSGFVSLKRDRAEWRAGISPDLTPHPAELLRNPARRRTRRGSTRSRHPR